MEIGLETVIPKDLSQDNLPPSFRFYDPIQLIINDGISEERRDIFYKKFKYNIMRIRK